MAAPLSVSKNDYRKNRKKNDIKTPMEVVWFLGDTLFQLLDHDKKFIVDVGCGDGRLCLPFKEKFNCIGLDIKKQKRFTDEVFFYQVDFMKPDFYLEYDDTFIVSKNTALVLCNPPFNQSSSGRGLFPELFLDRIFEMFGEDVPVVLFTPMGFRLNQRVKSARCKKYREGKPKITSIISMPLNIFEGVEFHNEILIWNLYHKKLKPHYWLKI